MVGPWACLPPGGDFITEAVRARGMVSPSSESQRVMVVPAGCTRRVATARRGRSRPESDAVVPAALHTRQRGTLPPACGPWPGLVLPLHSRSTAWSRCGHEKGPWRSVISTGPPEPHPGPTGGSGATCRARPGANRLRHPRAPRRGYGRVPPRARPVSREPHGPRRTGGSGGHAASRRR